MTNYTDYIAYFRSVANRVLANTPSHKTFYRKGLDEFLNGLTLDGNYPAMLLQKNEYSLIDNGYDSVTKRRSVTIIIFDHVDDIGNYEQIDTAFDNSEHIIDILFNVIRNDIHNNDCNNFIKMADLKNIEVLPVENEGDGNFGYFFEIPVYSTHNISILTP